ncbi:simple sugar transport system permease protein [Spinactinospora alkalitolerans]|uniref:Xylose transport system permease protein XylH n=1 Tax=Spinactinospora alkalitolerans TaxID=687207 RepID=A0A852TNQ0_9ACTN|nr:ABC transporter permease [Spinactinospora alkalitolerans]NYE45225.1 simple sugar transport system permease protein [Spinactinospora alkalitolerans]
MTRTLTAPEAAPGDGPGQPPTQVARRSLLRLFLARPEVGSLLGAVAVFIVFYAVAEPFRQAASFSTVLYASSTIGIMAVAVALLMIGGEFDLSAGVAVITSALTAAMFAFQLSLNVWVGVGMALLFSLSVGFANGWLLIRTRIPSFLVTLSTFLMLQGLNVAMTKLITGGVATDSISDMDGFASARLVFASSFQVGGFTVRVTVLWWLLFVAVATWVLLRTRIGNWIYAVGGSADSARAVGVPVHKVKIGLFMTVGFAAWFSGMHLLFAFNTVQSGEGVGNELLYIMAAVIGGCLLTGGYGTAVGAAIGAFIYGMTKQGIVYAGWDNNWLMFFVGAMLLLATLINAWVRRQTSRR